MTDCGCAIALRVSSTLAVKALTALHNFDPDWARRLMDETNQHAKRLRIACDNGNHGPQAKP